MRPAAGTAGHAVNRLLRPRTGADGRTRGTSRYYASFERLPAWYERDKHGATLVGVYENVEGNADRALLFFADRVEQVGSGEGSPSTVVVFSEILRVVPFSKERVARELSVEMKGGGVTTIAVEGPEGDVSLIARVLFNCMALA